MLSTPNKINNDIKGVLLERRRRPPARGAYQPARQYQHRLSRLSC
jgi:hypothetical protein